MELPWPDFLVVKLFWSNAGDAVAAVSQCPFFDKVKVFSGELVEVVFHLPYRRLVKEPNGVRRWWQFVRRLP